MRFFPVTRFTLSLVTFSVLFLGAASLQAKTCPTGRTKIVGGDQAKLGDWPGFAALRLYAAKRDRFAGE